MQFTITWPNLLFCLLRSTLFALAILCVMIVASVFV